MKKSLILLSLSIFILMSACGGGNASITVKMKTSGTATSSVNSDIVNINDSQEDTSGTDPDGDGGYVRFITPSSFKVAFKKLTFINKDTEEEFTVIEDTGTLANSEVLNLNDTVTIDTSDLSLSTGTYTYRAEIYYYEIVMPINLTDDITTIRLYMSDDDFSSEGNHGHHQGDITFINSAGDELGWVKAGEVWTETNLATTRPDQAGAGGPDSETGHKRGLFGDTELWDKTAFNQGPNQDIFILEDEFDLNVSGNAIITFDFDIANTWFYEDFDNNQKFNPCQGSGNANGSKDACPQAPDGAEWSPIFNPPNITIEGN